MRREHFISSHDWQRDLARLGFDYQSIDPKFWQTHWRNDAYYAFDERQIDTLAEATKELHQMYFAAARHVIKTGDYARLGIDDASAHLIESSFHPDTPTLYGRFDLWYDGKDAPKLYEYNADTPTLILESGVAQRQWLRTQNLNAEQFNSIHERLLLEFKALKSPHPLYFTAMSDESEDVIATRHLQDIAKQAGLSTHFIDISDIGHHDAQGVFVDLYDEPIEQLFKLYPWEWLVQDDFGRYLASSRTTFIEPAYKLLFGNKAMLCVLWELFPNHPNLLPAYFSPDTLGDHYVKKPFFSRQGANITLHTPQGETQTAGGYGTEGFVYQQAKLAPSFTDAQGERVYAVLSSWIIGHGTAGIGIRESHGAITGDDGVFVPHVFY